MKRTYEDRERDHEKIVSSSAAKISSSSSENSKNESPSSSSSMNDSSLKASSNSSFDLNDPHLQNLGDPPYFSSSTPGWREKVTDRVDGKKGAINTAVEGGKPRALAERVIWSAPSAAKGMARLMNCVTEGKSNTSPFGIPQDDDPPASPSSNKGKNIVYAKKSLSKGKNKDSPILITKGKSCSSKDGGKENGNDSPSAKDNESKDLSPSKKGKTSLLIQKGKDFPLSPKNDKGKDISSIAKGKISLGILKGKEAPLARESKGKNNISEDSQPVPPSQQLAPPIHEPQIIPAVCENVSESNEPASSSSDLPRHHPSGSDFPRIQPIHPNYLNHYVKKKSSFT